MAKFQAKLFLLMTLIAWATSAPTVAPCEKKSIRNLLHMLEDHKTSLQSFSPWPLCGSSMRNARSRLLHLIESRNNATKQEQKVASNKQQQLLDPIAPQDEDILSQMTGCTTADIQQLPVVLPGEDAPCSWTITCKYDESRFPEVLYTAVKTRNLNADSDLCDCMPIYRDVPVLRKTISKGCPVWQQRVEHIPVAFSCQFGFTDTSGNVLLGK